MIHLLFDDRPWFRPKRLGFGAGLPIAWQGWLLLGAHIALIVGVTLLLLERPVVQTVAALVIALAPLPLYAAKTDGGWRWRNGDEK